MSTGGRRASRFGSKLPSRIPARPVAAGRIRIGAMRIGRQRCSRRTVLNLLAVAASFLSSAAQAQIRPLWEAPVLTTVRYDENWDQFADPSKRIDWISKLKYIPLQQDPTTYLTAGIELRFRLESYRHDEWGVGPAASQTYLLSRIAPYVDLHVGKMRAFVQPMATVVSGGSGRPPVDGSGVELLQGFVDVDLSSKEDQLMIVRGGREMVSLGSERLVGTRYGPNTPRTFDGARTIWKTPISKITAFYLRPVDTTGGSFDDRTSRTQQLWGVYGTRLLQNIGGGVDLYYLGSANATARFANAAGREHRETIGARFFGRIALLHWNMEAIYQFGEIADRRISAYSIATDFGHKFVSLPLKPDFTIRSDIISGDDAKGAFGTFNALYPNGGYFGELYPVGPYNLINLNPAVAFDITDRAKFGVMSQFYWRDRVTDGVYSVPGILLRAPGSSKARFIGTQVEGTVQWRATTHLNLEASLSELFSGGFIRQTGSGRNIHLFALEANYRF